MGLPLLVFKEDGISGGVFDSGVTDVFIHKMPIGRVSKLNSLGVVFPAVCGEELKLIH